MQKDTDFLDKADLYELCQKIYRESRKDEPDVDTICDYLETAGFSLADIA